METMKVSDSVQIKGAVKDYLSGKIGRRSFLLRLTAGGLTATAAQRYFELVAAPAGSLQAGDTNQADILIRGAYVITMDDGRRVYTDGIAGWQSRVCWLSRLQPRPLRIRDR